MRRSARICVVVLLVLLARAEAASATPVTFILNTLFGGASHQSVLSATLGETTRDGTAGVLLTMAMSDVGSEYVSMWGFNRDPTLTPARPIYVSGALGIPTIDSDAGMLFNGGGYYDIFFTFSGGRFTSGSTSVWFFPGLIPENFLFLSDGAYPNPDATFYTAVYGRIVNGGSYWIGDGDLDPPPIPEPMTVLLTGVGLVAVSCAVRRRRGSGSR